MSLPWMKFWVGDWMNHPGLRSCSLAARALAIDLLCVMHQSEPYGHLRAGNKVLRTAELSRIVGAPLEEVEVKLNELLEAGVFARTSEGWIYSPRMVRDDQGRVKSKEHGARGGNPDLMGGRKPTDTRPSNPADNSKDNPPHARARSEVRSQKSEDLPARPVRREKLPSEQGLKHAEAIRVWREIYEAETGCPYTFNDSTDGKQIKRLLQFTDFSFEELTRRATRFLRDPFWAEKGVDLKRFVTQWTAMGNAGRKVEAIPQRSEQPSDDERDWTRRALRDPNPVVQDQARKRLQRWNLTEADLLGESA